MIWKISLMLFYNFNYVFIGWSAAVANMLDTVEKFEFKANIFENDFKRYLDGREDSIKLLNKYYNIFVLLFVFMI